LKEAIRKYTKILEVYIKNTRIILIIFKNSTPVNNQKDVGEPVYFKNKKKKNKKQTKTVLRQRKYGEKKETKKARIRVLIKN
jgi:hypothetical protein